MSTATARFFQLQFIRRESTHEDNEAGHAGSDDRGELVHPDSQSVVGGRRRRGFLQDEVRGMPRRGCRRKTGSKNPQPRWRRSEEGLGCGNGEGRDRKTEACWSDTVSDARSSEGGGCLHPHFAEVNRNGCSLLRTSLAVFGPVGLAGGWRSDRDSVSHVSKLDSDGSPGSVTS